MKFIKRLIFTILLIIIITVSGIFYTGYNMYQQAISKISIEERIKGIKNNENYISFDEIPDDFKHAIVAVEDHRFYNHNGIDLITTARSMIENISKKDIVAGRKYDYSTNRKTFVFYARAKI